MLDDRGAAVDPVAAVQVADAADLAHRGGVDVSAHDAVDAALARMVQDRVLEVENEAHRAFDLALSVTGERPVAGHTKQPPHARQPQVEAHQNIVGPVAEQREPAVIARDLVELVAVDQQIAPSVGGDMHVIALDPDVAERGADVLARGLIVIAGHEHDVHALARVTQDLLHQRVLRGRPVHAAAAHRPEIDDVAEQKQVLGLVGFEKLEQPLRLAGARPQVHVGDEDRPHALRGDPGLGRGGPVRAVIGIQ